MSQSSIIKKTWDLIWFTTSLIFYNLLLGKRLESIDLSLFLLEADLVEKNVIRLIEKCLIKKKWDHK